MKFTPLLPDLGMKTEIKFRAWDKKARTMIPWELILKECDRLSFLSHDGFVVEQYTGLNDSKGKEIYEGDIYDPCIGEDHILIVVVDESNTGFKFQRPNNRPTAFTLTKDECQEYGEIIGNIHEK